MLFELVLTQSYQNQEVINRWNYLFTGTPASVTPSFALVSAFGGIPDPITHAFPSGSMMEALAALQNTSLLYTSIIGKNIYTLDDFYATPFPVGQAGAYGTGDPSAPFLAYGLNSTQVTRAIRGGQKRIAGVSEGAIQVGGQLVSGSATLLQNIADLMGENLTYDDEGTTLTFIPCVVQKEKYTTPSGKQAYRYYSTLAAQVPDHVAQSPVWAIKTFIRSQTSRQYGRGK